MGRQDLVAVPFALGVLVLTTTACGDGAPPSEDVQSPSATSIGGPSDPVALETALARRPR